MAQHALEIQNISIKFYHYTVFENLSFQLNQGKFLVVIGPNGAGKSCLIKVILNILQPATGTIHIEGKVPGQVPFGWIGYIPQLKTLDRTFPGRAIDLVMTGLKPGWPWAISQQNNLKVKLALEEVGASHLLNQPLGKLSGGELQRIYLARCLIRKPKLLLLDEPLTGIDPGLKEDIYTILGNIRKETHPTIMMVTHDLIAASHHADQVLLLNQNLSSFGTPQEVLMEESLQKAFGHGRHAHTMMREG